jgi:hypothetical protein
MFCLKCGSQLPDDALFCFKCGAKVGAAPQVGQQPPSSGPVLAPTEATSLKCPNCGAPISPKFGEMVITCEYCGGSISLGSDGWRSIQKHTMLPLKFGDKDTVLRTVHQMMDSGLLRRHLQESSVLEEATLTVVPYWIIPVSARTSIVATDVAVEAGTLATTAALFGVMGGLGGRRGPGFGGGLVEGALLGSVMGGGMGGGPRKSITMDANYNYPVVALKALSEYQPKEYQFALDERTLFDPSKLPKGVKVLNGDVGEDMAKYQAKTMVDQLQAQKAHSKYHMIQQMETQMDVSDGELLHVPVWMVRYDHKGHKIVLVLDGNSGMAINSIGL